MGELNSQIVDKQEELVELHDCCIARNMMNEKSLFMEDICKCVNINTTYFDLIQK